MWPCRQDCFRCWCRYTARAGIRPPPCRRGRRHRHRGQCIRAGDRGDSDSNRAGGPGPRLRRRFPRECAALCGFGAGPVRHVDILVNNPASTRRARSPRRPMSGYAGCSLSTSTRPSRHVNPSSRTCKSGIGVRHEHRLGRGLPRRADVAGLHHQQSRHGWRYPGTCHGSRRMGVTANVIAPGLMGTPGTSSGLMTTMFEEVDRNAWLRCRNGEVITSLVPAGHREHFAVETIVDRWQRGPTL
jgi:hypothetical protein